MRENNSLGDKFAGFTSEPNPEVWENIERSLDDKPRRRVFAWWIFLAAGAVVGIIVWNFQGENVPEGKKYVSKENTMTKPATQSGSPFNVSAEEKSAQNESIESKASKFQSVSGQAVISKRAQNVISGQASLSSVNKIEELHLTKGSKTELTASENANDPTLNAHLDKPEDELLSENNLQEEDSLTAGISPDTSVLSQNLDLNMERIEPKINRWQVQFQIGTLTSRKEEMWVPSMNDPYYEGSGNVGNGGYLPITLGNSQILKPYRNITANYGVLVSYNTTGRWRLTSGFSYLRYYMYTLDDRVLHSGSHYVQIPVIADFKLLNKPKWEWSLGTGTSLGHVWEKKSAAEFSSWRSDFIAQTSLRYSLNQRIILQLQPQARFLYWDQQAGKLGKLSPWYWGGNVGAVWCF